MPAVSDEPVKELEDTLDESDAVPAVDTMVVPPAEAAKFSAPPKKKISLWLQFLLVLAVAAAAVVVVLWVLSR
jgi:hypothetical protein